jgi:uncharacterized protein (TIGR02246 family)
MTDPQLDQLSINTIHTLSMDAVQQAKSGHPGTPMALAPLVYTLWNRVLRFDPQDPIWPNRDRFVLSNGHASMLLWSVLHLTRTQAVNADYEILGHPSVSLDDIRHFRQLSSRAPGHPEYHWVSGVETTTGPLGQGVATSVGMAIAQKWLANRYNEPGFDVFDYDIYAVCGDGCMMERVASEAASLAGHLGLDNLCWIWHNNHITIEGNTKIAFTEDVAARFLAYDWNVLRVGDANDLERIQHAFAVFHKGDARALAAFWTPNGDYTDESGRHLKGREAIEKAFEQYFAENKGLKVRIESQSLRFVTPDVALEEGVTEVIAPKGGPPSRDRYSIVHVKREGHWLLGSVHEAAYVPPSNHEYMRGLEWAIGDWAGEAGNGEAERLAVAWAENENFVIATFTRTSGDMPVAGATQWIGWDPLDKHLRSWIFDAAGGFGEGSWTQDGNKWVIRTNSVLQDGKKAMATFILTPVDADALSLQARDRNVEGKPVPDGPEIKLKRVK